MRIKIRVHQVRRICRIRVLKIATEIETQNIELIGFSFFKIPEY